MVPLIIVLIGFSGFSPGSVGRASAQSFYGVVYRPPGVVYDVLPTEHFEIIFQRGLDTLVYDAAVTLEEAYSRLKERTGLARGLKMPVVLNDYNDVSNGFVSAAPFRQEIDASPIKGKVLSPRHADWMHQVLPHELTHAAQAEVSAGFGVGSVLSFMSPDLGRALNLGIPSGMTEGMAVLQESSETEGAGRLNFSMTLMQFRAAAASGSPWKIGELLDPPSFTQPSNRYYIGGGVLTQYLADSVRADFFERSIKFYNRVPFLGYGAALWFGTGRNPWALSREFTAQAARAEADRQAALGEITEAEIVTDEPGLACRRPKWIADDEILAHCSGYARAPGFYKIDVSTGHMDYAFRESITEDFLFTLDRDRGRILFAQYHPHGTVTISSISNVHEVEFETGRDTKLPNSRRVYAPVRVSEDAIWALRDRGQFNEVIELRDDGEHKLIFYQYGTITRELSVGPEGDVIALSNRSGEQSIYMFVEEVDGWQLWPLVAVRDGAIYDPDWSTNGEQIIFAADPGGVSNLYAYSIKENQVRKLTNVRYGAVEPSLSPDGDRLVYANYEHEQYQVAVIKFDLTNIPFEEGFGHPVQPVPTFGPIPDAVRDSLVALVKPYRPFPAMLKPRAVAPFVRFKQDRLSPFDQRLGLGLGLTVLGADPLQQWSYSLTGFWQENRMWGRASVTTGTNVLRPFMRVLNEPRTTTVALGDTAFARVTLEERSARIGGALPIRISRNVHSTSVILGLNADYRWLRLIDSDARPLSEFDRRVTINPTVLFAYKLQTNIRDFIPNSGFLIASTAEIDTYASSGVSRARAWRTEASAFLPFLHKRNRGIRLSGGGLWQNRGSVLNVDTFLPRGWENQAILGAGVYLKAGIEVVQPILYLDQGLILLPITLEGLYVYGFAETMGLAPEYEETYTSLGMGFGARVRLFHNLSLNARISASRLLEDAKWVVSFR